MDYGNNCWLPHCTSILFTHRHWQWNNSLHTMNQDETVASYTVLFLTNTQWKHCSWKQEVLLELQTSRPPPPPPLCCHMHSDSRLTNHTVIPPAFGVKVIALWAIFLCKSKLRVGGCVCVCVGGRSEGGHDKWYGLSLTLHWLDRCRWYIQYT